MRGFMHIHILGIGGKFMAGAALLAQQAGHTVSGSDVGLYPPMSTQLEEMGVEVTNSYEDLSPLQSRRIDRVIVGNVIRRGTPIMEYILNQKIPYISGPQWLAEEILKDRWVIAIAGTHGKTTTTSLVSWILEYAGLEPGFLIGGVPENFGISARLGSSPFFVIEADEYDSAFFDKRPKFIHYHPKTLIMNNLEFDHADIFPDLAAIKQQFHYLVRTVPSEGLIIYNGKDANLSSVLELGCWTPTLSFAAEGARWQAKLLQEDGGAFEVYFDNVFQGLARWNLIGKHNVENGLAACAAAVHAGVPIAQALAALAEFKNVKKRLEVIAEVQGVTVYDDFAHHPTAIATTLAGLRAKVGKGRIILVLEFGSYTMRTGVHKDSMPEALALADKILCKKPQGQDWGVADVLKKCPQASQMYTNVDALIAGLISDLHKGDHVIIMSNSGFDGLNQKLLTALSNKVYV
jgi:UDP-N-acetylmuramate: L-alanyl-gamma-D-glutamyl-meso-diaminopimelate ligase